MDKKRSFKLFGFGVFLYLVSASLSYAAFSFLPKGETQSVVTSPIPNVTNSPSRFVIDPSLSRTEICPLNGVKYPKKYREIWEKRRPLAVMIENSVDARPQSGLSLADIVYEAVAEGGTTRFMGVFYCGATVGNISFAPVRSARVYYLHWLLEYDALYNHVGGANRYGGNIDKTDPRADAISLIHRYGIKDLDQFGIAFPDCYRNYDRLGRPVATEHTMVCQSENLYKLADKREWTSTDEKGIPWDKNFVAWKFKKEIKKNKRGSISPIEFDFWSGYKDYSVRWEYDRETNTYLRFTGDKIHKDLETGEQLSSKNIVIQFARETRRVDELGHLLYDNIGTGKAIVFQDGDVIKSTWSKKSIRSRTKFFDTKGKEISFNPGQIWIELVPLGNDVTYPE